MFCGFGAVVLLVLILNSDTVRTRNETFSDLRAEAVRLEQEVIVGKENLVIAKNSLEATKEDLVVTEGANERALKNIRELEVEIAELERETLAAIAHVNMLSSDLEDLDEEKKRLGAAQAADKDRGAKVHRVAGQGDRQYLTGLKVGGERILILLDASASMLDENDFVRLIEESGGRVVADDMPAGTRYFQADVDEDDPDPLRALARRYLEEIACPRKMLPEAHLAHMLDLLEGTGARGVVIHNLRACDCHLYEYPYFKKELEARGLSVLFFRGEETATELEQQRTDIEAFVEMIEG